MQKVCPTACVHHSPLVGKSKRTSQQAKFASVGGYFSAKPTDYVKYAKGRKKSMFTCPLPASCCAKLALCDPPTRGGWFTGKDACPTVSIGITTNISLQNRQILCESIRGRKVKVRLRTSLPPCGGVEWNELTSEVWFGEGWFLNKT